MSHSDEDRIKADRIKMLESFTEESIEVIGFSPTPKEQKVIGYATLRITSLINFRGTLTRMVKIERFKLTRGDKGGEFVQSCSIKADSAAHENVYEKSNEFDSNFLGKEVEKMIKQQYKNYLESSGKTKQFVDTKPARSDVEDQWELPL